MSNLEEFIKRLPGLRRATTPEDGQKILSFLERNSSSQRRLTLFYDRSPDFFALLNLSSPHQFVCNYLDESGDIQGLITYSIFNSKGFDILYIGDFKIKSKSEKFKSDWRNFAQEFIENVNSMEEFKNVKYVYLVMMDDNTRAYQRLVASNVLSFKYKKTQGYKMINLMGMKPWKSFKKEYIPQIFPATEENLFQVLHESSKNRFGSNADSFLRYRAQKMAPYAQILQLKDKHGEIVFTCSLEDISPVKRILMKRLPISLRAFSKILPMVKGKSYQEGKPMDILYFSNISYHPMLEGKEKEKASILNHALKAALEYSNKRFHMVSLSLFNSEDYLIDGIKNYFMTQIEPLGYYQVIPTSGVEIPSEPLPNLNMSYI